MTLDIRMSPFAFRGRSFRFKNGVIPSATSATGDSINCFASLLSAWYFLFRQSAMADMLRALSPPPRARCSVRDRPNVRVAAMRALAPLPRPIRASPEDGNFLGSHVVEPARRALTTPDAYTVRYYQVISPHALKEGSFRPRSVRCFFNAPTLNVVMSRAPCLPTLKERRRDGYNIQRVCSAILRGRQRLRREMPTPPKNSASWGLDRAPSDERVSKFNWSTLILIRNELPIHFFAKRFERA